MKRIVALQYHKKKISGEVSADLSLFRWGEKNSAKVKNSKRTEKSTSEGTTHDQMFKNVSLGQQEINVVQA